ncbi:trypsin-like serine protease [Sorangium sp. So ce1099]|uniref:trypsin-like serine protease n=1 Tax=Sorangium sp. So ce1099 TaxID=3133331 RepID=UPI003F61FBD8
MNQSTTSISQRLSTISQLIVAGLALAVSACALEPESEPNAAEEIDSAEQLIRNGDGLPDGYAAVVRITGATGCSGVLLTNSLVLTAKHCIYAWTSFNEATPVPLNMAYDPRNLSVTFESQVRRGSLVFWNGAAVDTALIRVDQPFTVGGATTGWRRSIRRSAVAVNSTLECYGYGNNAVNSAGQEVGFGSLRHSSNRVTSVAATTFGIEVNSAGQISMRGDSGGPCFSGQEVAGVFSRGNSVTTSTLALGAGFVSWADEYMALFPNGNEVRDGVLLRDNVGRISVVLGGAPLWISGWDEYVRDWSARPLYQTGPTALPAVPRDGTLLRDPGGEIDIFYGGARFPIPSMNEFYALGLSTSNLQAAPSGSFFGMPRIPRDGVALRDRLGEIDIIQGGRRWHVLSMSTYNALYRTWPLYPIPAGGLSAIPYGGDIP